MAGPSIILYPNREHCVESVARQRHRALLAALLAAPKASPELVAELELLTRFLQSADFRALRAASDKLLQRQYSVKATVRQSGAAVECDFAASPEIAD